MYACSCMQVAAHEGGENAPFVAVKKLRLGSSADVGVHAHAVRELQALMHMQGAGVPRLLHTFVKRKRMYFVTPMADTDLHKLMRAFTQHTACLQHADACARASQGALPLRAAAMPPDLVRSIMAGVCRAVASIHAKGWIHHDVKPSNILVSLHTATDLHPATSSGHCEREPSASGVGAHTHNALLVQLCDLGIASRIYEQLSISGDVEESVARRVFLPPSCQLPAKSTGTLSEEEEDAIWDTQASPWHGDFPQPVITLYVLRTRRPRHAQRIPYLRSPTHTRTRPRHHRMQRVSSTRAAVRHDAAWRRGGRVVHGHLLARTAAHACGKPTSCRARCRCRGLRAGSAVL
ncbi:hypothetical protein EON67_09655 [archaeon]|nr:MAG: hypothetical protein EON67_09655 [archaeon]